MVVVVVCRADPGPGGDHDRQPVRRCSSPSAPCSTRGWRKIGAAVVRWPGPILVATIALALVGLLTLPGYQTNYNDRNYLPADLPGQRGLRRRRPALLAGPDEPRTADGRERSRPAQLGGLPGHRQDRQGHLPGAGHRAGADDHPAARASRSSTPRSRSRSACRAPRRR